MASNIRIYYHRVTDLAYNGYTFHLHLFGCNIYLLLYICLSLAYNYYYYYYYYYCELLLYLHILHIENQFDYIWHSWRFLYSICCLAKCSLIGILSIKIDRWGVGLCSTRLWAHIFGLILCTHLRIEYMLHAYYTTNMAFILLHRLFGCSLSVL
jgi:hypothetical protein